MTEFASRLLVPRLRGLLPEALQATGSRSSEEEVVLSLPGTRTWVALPPIGPVRRAKLDIKT